MQSFWELYQFYFDVTFLSVVETILLFTKILFLIWWSYQKAYRDCEFANQSIEVPPTYRKEILLNL